ncbi:MAG: serine/threonine protein phosphatase [Devosiaceae bacterium]|nr:serine/threonine protein phosphatase [Devosiaceae bacterium MH13]
MSDPFPPPRVLSAGTRVYAIGDVHGRADLLLRLLDAIDADLAARPPAHGACIVPLGDLVDRGPGSRTVLDVLLAADRPDLPVITLRGNHDDWMLRALEGETGHLGSWWEHGGRETAMSYGVKVPISVTARVPAPEVIDAFKAAVPPDHLGFLRSLPAMALLPGYAFVHAGVRPGVPLAEQDPKELMWIRHAFLDSDADHGAIIVHGHTPTDTVEVRANRIGIDIGAHATNRLACLIVEDGTHELMVATARTVKGPAPLRP